MSNFSAKKLNRIRFLANIMDSAIKVPFLKLRIGLDSIIGLLPVGGDIITLCCSLWILKEAWDLNIPQNLRQKMLANILIDFIIGLFPVIGDFFDVIFKANLKNLEIIETYINSKNADI